MFLKKHFGLITAGLAAGTINGLFGGGGGMVLVPLLTLLSGLDEKEIFSSSVAIILPICITSLAVLLPQGSLSLPFLLPYLCGSLAGGLIAWKIGKKIPTKYLHRILGFFVLWGGIRYVIG